MATYRVYIKQVSPVFGVVNEWDFRDIQASNKDDARTEGVDRAYGQGLSTDNGTYVVSTWRA